MTIVELNFPVALYKKLLKKTPTLEDLKELMPVVGRSVIQNPSFSTEFTPSFL